MAEDFVLSILKRAVEEMETEIQLLATRRRAIIDVNDGKLVDASQETLLLKRVYRDRLSELVTRLESPSASLT